MNDSVKPNKENGIYIGIDNLLENEGVMISERVRDHAIIVDKVWQVIYKGNEKR